MAAPQAAGKISAHVVTFSLLLTPAIIYAGYYYKFGPDDEAKAAAIRQHQRKDPSAPATKARTVEHFQRLASQDASLMGRVDAVLKGGAESNRSRDVSTATTTTTTTTTTTPSSAETAPTPAAPLFVTTSAEEKSDLKQIRTRLTSKVAAKKLQSSPIPPPPSSSSSSSSSPPPPSPALYAGLGAAAAAAALGALYFVAGGGGAGGRRT